MTKYKGPDGKPLRIRDLTPAQQKRHKAIQSLRRAVNKYDKAADAKKDAETDS